MPQKIIPFEEKLHQKVGATLEAAGFVASKETIERDMKALIYHNKANPKNAIVFHAMVRINTLHPQRFEFNWLRIQVVTANNQYEVLPVTSQDVSAGTYGNTGWIYNDEAGLDRSLDEISEIVEQNFRSWFE